jgi:serine/threonine protein kinase
MLIKVKRFKEYDARMILIDILTGYQELLVNGIIHRDLKPENILINNGKC